MLIRQVASVSLKSHIHSVISDTLRASAEDVVDLDQDVRAASSDTDPPRRTVSTLW